MRQSGETLLGVIVDVNTGNLAGAYHHLLDHMKNIFLPRKRHFQVELREFELAVSAQIFIAKTLHDLKVFVQSRDHQNLLENLRRLRQRVKLAMMDTAG